MVEQDKSYQSGGASSDIQNDNTSNRTDNLKDNDKKLDQYESKIKSNFIESFANAPVRIDVISRVFNLMRRNTLQPHGVKWSNHPRGFKAGHRNSARSWGTGRAKARVPRVKGSGTHRSGQAAVANFARKGHMFSPIMIWRRWHRLVNKKERNLALLSAFRSSFIAPLVKARGHILPQQGTLPIVIKDDDFLEALDKENRSVKARALLKRIGLTEELERCEKSKKKNKGRSRMRGRKYRVGRGPLIVYHLEKSGDNEDNGVEKEKEKKISNKKLAKRAKFCFGKIRGVEVMSASSANLLLAAPGGEAGRLIVWTESALERITKKYLKLEEKGDVGEFRANKLLGEKEIDEILRDEKVRSVFTKKDEIVGELHKLSMQSEKEWGN